MYSPDEQGTARRIADTYGDSLAWSEELSKWMVRRPDESIWRTDTLVERTSKAMIVCNLQQRDNPNVKGLTRLAHMRAALELCKPLVAVELEQFDTNPWALNTPNGLINLMNQEYVDPN